MTPKLKKIIIAIVVLGILFLLYVVFLKPDPEGDVLVVGRNTGATGAVSSQDTAVLASQISQALLKIEQITLNRGIFEDPIFTSLEDRSQPIIDEPIGRTNPFAPLGDTSVNVTSRSNLNIGTSSSSTSTSTPQAPRTTPPAATTTPATGAPVILN